MTTYRQDMPPSGGYAPIQFLRKVKKRPINGLLVIAGLYSLSYVGYLHISKQRNIVSESLREDEETRIALSPFILAEQERLFLKQVIRNRDYEAALMADVPGWKVGYWHDYPVYHNPRGLWCVPTMDEFYAHTTRSFRNSRIGVHNDYL